MTTRTISPTLTTAVRVLMLFLTVLCATPGQSCDCWIAMRDATKDASILLAKNSDRPPAESQPLVSVPRQQHQAGTMVKCTYIEIPQVSETYEHIGSKIWWTFGYEHGMNEHGVAIGNEAVWSKEPLEGPDGLLGMDLVRLGLERGKTAYEAMHVIVRLLEKYGQCGNCVHQSEAAESRYHNSFLIADPEEAWVLETAGQFWVAKKITSGVYSISNIYTIETQWNECHPKLIQNAIDKGWAKSEQSFNFARAYGDYTRKDAPPWAMQIRRNCTLDCLQKELPAGVSPSTMMQTARSHYEGTIVEPRWGAAETFWPTICMHDSPNLPSRTAASMVAHLRSGKPPLLRQVYWAAFGNPCCSVYQPFYLHGVRVPQQFSTGTGDYAADSPWWSATRIKLACDLNYPKLNPVVRQTFDATEQWEMQRQQQVEAQAMRLVREGKEAAAQEQLQAFVDENVARVAQERKGLNDVLPKLLKDAGVEYLFLDYLKDWTQKRKVALPLP
jgi:secernin